MLYACARCVRPLLPLARKSVGQVRQSGVMLRLMWCKPRRTSECGKYHEPYASENCPHIRMCIPSVKANFVHLSIEHQKSPHDLWSIWCAVILLCDCSIAELPIQCR
ncbi:hypothetical protein OH76DRAFT_1095092 [Lentinus brumalis]|uniref:Uncharacterized protein n=1 Tax=Lentinus brumalis TaxID=2498619 RepID=A0A371CW30_9APHY|nr:hypothetical protein OH76DRAFT_1095092 [Polyporus brumalis]